MLVVCACGLGACGSLGASSEPTSETGQPTSVVVSGTFVMAVAPSSTPATTVTATSLRRRAVQLRLRHRSRWNPVAMTGWSCSTPKYFSSTSWSASRSTGAGTASPPTIIQSRRSSNLSTSSTRYSNSKADGKGRSRSITSVSRRTFPSDVTIRTRTASCCRRLTDGPATFWIAISRTRISACFVAVRRARVVPRRTTGVGRRSAARALLNSLAPDCYGHGVTTSSGPPVDVERDRPSSSEPSFDLVESKLHPPPMRHGIVSRAELVNRLVTAPGAGGHLRRRPGWLREDDVAGAVGRTQGSESGMGQR